MLNQKKKKLSSQSQFVNPFKIKLKANIEDLGLSNDQLYKVTDFLAKKGLPVKYLLLIDNLIQQNPTLNPRMVK